MKSWGKTRQKGKTTYLLKGAIWSMFIAVSSELFAQYELPLAEIYFSYQFLLKIIVYTLAGTLLAAYWWKASCKRYKSHI
jgi:hypothetical protein